MSDALVTEKMLATAVEAAGLDGAMLRSGPAALASPSYKALESASVFAQGHDGARFVKVMHPEMRAAFDLESAATLAAEAGNIAVGPRVTWSDNEHGAVAMEGLMAEDGWRTANQYILQDPEIVASVMATIRALHRNQTVLTVRFDPFARIDAIISQAGLLGVSLPADLVWLRRLVAQIEPLAERADHVGCRNDGSSSNLMIGPDKAVRLVDFDRAGLNDPLYDVGTLLAEVTDFERDMKAGFIAYAGRHCEVDFARARLWSFVDDMLHAVWFRVMAHVSVRTGLEWLKYGEWRLMRLRMALNHPQFEERLRIAGVTQ
jgi:thiamine kinase-like enzyme